MARRKKTSGAEDLLDLIAMLPWWVGFALAIVSFLILNRIAAQPIPVATTGSQPSSFYTSTVFKGVAIAGQWILPIFCLCGAAMSAWRRRRRNALFDDAAQASAASAIDGMRWQEFEMLVGEGFRRLGYQVVETGGGGADGGVDLVLSRPAQNGSEKVLVQCKQWRALKVGVDIVRELYGVMAARGATAGIVVTAGRFTAEAEAFAQGRNVALVDGPALEELIHDAQSEKSNRERSNTQTLATSATLSEPTVEASPRCPSCGAPMVRRVAKRGAAPGSRLWGCALYPSCRGTRPMPEH